MLRITFRNELKFIEQMRQRGPAIISVLSTKLTSLMFLLQSKVQTEFLSGQALHAVTGKLRGSIEAHPTRVEGSKLIGEVSGAGGPAFYGAVHEFGGTHSYEILAVKSRALAFIAEGKQVFAARVSRSAAVARPFMRPALTAFAPTIVSELNAAVDRVIKEE